MSVPAPDSRASWKTRVRTDWWAAIVAGAITALAVTNLLPEIPWWPGPVGAPLVAVIGLLVVVTISLGLVLLTSRVFGRGGHP